MAIQDAQQHLRVCERFAETLGRVDGRWDASTPCSEWDVWAVVEHVIGFHDVLLLRPLGAKPARPRDDPVRRWAVTVDALHQVLSRSDLFDGVVQVPAVGDNPPTTIDARAIVPMLTQDVFVHTWDVASAIGVERRLDPDVCEALLARLPRDDRLQRSGMFAAPVDISDDADAQSRFLARLGRDPAWGRGRRG